MKRKKPKPDSKRVEKLAKDLGVNQFFSAEMHDIRCGVHSGFKDCCITWWVLHERPVCDLTDGGMFSELVANTAQRQMDRYRNFLRARGVNVGYIPCPKCALEKTFVKVKKCDCFIGED